MSAQLELVPPIAEEASGGASEETPPPEKCYTALPHECAEGYAEQFLGSPVVNSNQLTRVVLAELLSSKAPLNTRKLAEKIAPKTGDRMGGGLITKIRTAIKRILKEIPGIIENDRREFFVSQHGLQARGLDAEGLDSASYKAKRLAKDRINSRWHRQKEDLLLRLKNEYGLNDEEVYILGMLILNIPKGIKQAGSRADLLQELLARLPLGYIAESGDTFHAGDQIIKELGGGLPIRTYEDINRITLPKKPFGFLGRHVKTLTSANEPPAALDPHTPYYVNPRTRSGLAQDETPVWYVPPPDGAKKYDMETAHLFDLSHDRIVIGWKDDMGQTHFGSISRKNLVTAEMALSIRNMMEGERAKKRAKREAHATARAAAHAAAHTPLPPTASND